MSDSHLNSKTNTDRELASRSVSPLGAGLKCACPKCGEGKLFTAGYLVPGEVCAHCGLDFSFIDSGDGPAVFVLFILGFGLAIIAALLHALFAPPMWVHAVVWVCGTVAGTFYFLRVLKAYMIALQYTHDAKEGSLEEGENA